MLLSSDGEGGGRNRGEGQKKFSPTEEVKPFFQRQGKAPGGGWGG